MSNQEAMGKRPAAGPWTLRSERSSTLAGILRRPMRLRRPPDEAHDAFGIHPFEWTPELRIVFDAWFIEHAPSSADSLVLVLGPASNGCESLARPLSASIGGCGR